MEREWRGWLGVGGSRGWRYLVGHLMGRQNSPSRRSGNITVGGRKKEHTVNGIESIGHLSAGYHH